MEILTSEGPGSGGVAVPELAAVPLDELLEETELLGELDELELLDELVLLKELLDELELLEELLTELELFDELLGVPELLDELLSELGSVEVPSTGSEFSDELSEEPDEVLSGALTS